jgi:hypothetical protein
MAEGDGVGLTGVGCSLSSHPFAMPSRRHPTSKRSVRTPQRPPSTVDRTAPEDIDPLASKDGPSWGVTREVRAQVSPRTSVHGSTPTVKAFEIA